MSPSCISHVPTNFISSNGIMLSDVRSIENDMYNFTPEHLKNERGFFKILDVYIKIVSFFECSKCGECCHMNSPRLYSDEYQYFGRDLSIWIDDNLASLKKPCPFFANNSCKTQDYKPRLCRFAPFVFILHLPDKPIAVSECDLGKKIVYKFIEFICETDRDLEQYPFDNFRNMKAFLKWLKKNSDKK